MVESGVDACALDTRASGGDCVGRFSIVQKCSCHRDLAATDALSDSSFPSSAFNGAEVAHFCFSCRTEAKASLIGDDSHPSSLPAPSIAAYSAAVIFSMALPGVCIPLHLPSG